MAVDLTLEDISGVIRLVREVCDRWDDPRAWREHLLAGACRLLGGNAGMMLADYEGRAGSFGRLAVTSLVGLPAPMKALAGPAVSEMAGRGYDDVSENVLPGM